MSTLENYLLYDIIIQSHFGLKNGAFQKKILETQMRFTYTKTLSSDRVKH